MQKVLRRCTPQLFFTLLLLSLLSLSFGHIDRLSAGVYKGLLLCGHAVIPTLFPFLILSELLLSAPGTRRLLLYLSRPFAKILKLSPAGGSAFLLGNLFGFPMGAKTTAKYYTEGAISREEAERLLLFSGNASPFFLIGSVGAGMLFSVKKGVFLYLLQVAISLLCGILLARMAKTPPSLHRPKISPHISRVSFSATVQGAVKQSLFICGYIVFFSSLAALLLPDIKNSHLAHFFLGLLEIGNATAAAAEGGGKYALPFCAFSASFSGLSVYFQTLDCISCTDLKAKSYLPVKFLSGAVAFFLSLLFTAPN